MILKSSNKCSCFVVAVIFPEFGTPDNKKDFDYTLPLNNILGK